MYSDKGVSDNVSWSQEDLKPISKEFKPSMDRCCIRLESLKFMIRAGQYFVDLILKISYKIAIN